MITIPNYNSEKYTVLLQKSWNELYEANKLKDADRNDANNGKISFSNLQHYFSYIQELIQLDRTYIMMPIDEQPFRIDANTRIIDVPRVFSNCGGVQSDSYAEIITFTIDRYFDYQDLANVNIMVQWRNESSKVEGFSIIDLIDLETEGADNKIRFGWPLTKDMTSAAGILTFAVRFFHTGFNPQTKTEELTYVLNTLASSITIKPTLNINLNNPNLKVNENDYEHFLNFVMNSANPSYSIPTGVQFITELPKTAKINKNDTLTLQAWATTKDRNVLIYEWYRKLINEYGPYTPEKNEFPERRPSINLYTLTEGDNPTYVKYEGNWPPAADTYEVSDFYVYEPAIKLTEENTDNRFEVTTSMELYYPVDADGEYCWPQERPKGLVVWTKDETVTPFVYRVYNGDWPQNVAENDRDLYTNIAKLIFKADGGENILGKYFVRAINRVVDGDEIVNEVFADSPTIGTYCLIAEPNEIHFTTNLNNACFLNTAGTLLKVVLEKDKNNPDLTYELRDYNQKEIVEVGGETVERGYKVIETTKTTSNVAQFTVSTNGKYKIAVTSELNRHSQDAISEECSVYNLPVSIPGVMYVDDVPITSTDNNTDTFEYDGENMITINALDVDNYTFKVVPDFTGIDPFNYQNISYKWSRAVENEDIEPVVITNNMIGTESDIKQMTNNELQVIARHPDSKKITYYCDVYNTIQLPNSTESKTANPTTYIFVVC